MKLLNYILESVTTLFAHKQIKRIYKSLVRNERDWTLKTERSEFNFMRDKSHFHFSLNNIDIVHHYNYDFVKLYINRMEFKIKWYECVLLRRGIIKLLKKRTSHNTDVEKRLLHRLNFDCPLFVTRKVFIVTEQIKDSTLIQLWGIFEDESDAIAACTSASIGYGSFDYNKELSVSYINFGLQRKFPWKEPELNNTQYNEQFFDKKDVEIGEWTSDADSDNYPNLKIELDKPEE